MNLLNGILTELDTPDDQGRDWYGWASNQCAHAFLGAVVGVLFVSHSVLVAGAIATLKELTDIIRVPSARTLRDSVQDIAFWLLGAWVVSAGENLPVAIILTAFALICGVIPRARKAARLATLPEEK